MSENARDDLIIEAAANLVLEDITLVRSVYDRPQNMIEGSEMVLQERRGVGFVVGGDSEAPILHARVNLGMRLVSAEDHSQVFVVIEADYLVDYKIKAELGGAAIKAFAEFNAVHNVWPFWRQQIFDIVDKGRLPKIKVPFFAGRKLPA